MNVPKKLALALLVLIAVALNLCLRLTPSYISYPGQSAAAGRENTVTRGRVYLLESDPYYWMTMVELVLTNGYPGTSRRGGRIYDDLLGSANGTSMGPNRFLYYLSAYIYRLCRVVVPELGLGTFLFYLPLAFLLVFFIVLFLFCNRFFSALGGVLAVFFTGFTPMLFYRSSAGAFDTDVLNLLFPLLIVWCLAGGMEKKRLLDSVFMSFSAAFFTALFAFTWSGWWFICVIIALFFISAVSQDAILFLKDAGGARSGQEVQKDIICFAAFTAGCLGLCMLVGGINPVSSVIGFLRENYALGRPLAHAIWPRGFSMVAELTQGNARTIAALSGGTALVSLSVLGMLWIYMRERNGRSRNAVLMLVIWAVVMVYASFRAVRFVMFLSVPLGIFLGEGLKRGGDAFSAAAKRMRNKFLSAVGLVTGILVLAVGVSAVAMNGFRLNRAVCPFINDGIYGQLENIRKTTPQDSIVYAWWHMGNWVRNVARRRVALNSQNQNSQDTYWMARALMSGNEEEALRILRMINNSSDALFGKLESFFGDPFRAEALMDRAVKSGRGGIETIFDEYGLPPRLRKDVMEGMFGGALPPAYIVLDRDIFEDLEGLTYIANWDFAKVFAAERKDMPEDEAIEGLMDTFSVTAGEAGRIYKETMACMDNGTLEENLSERWDLVGRVGAGRENDGVVLFDNGAALDVGRMSAELLAAGQRPPRAINDFIYYDIGGKTWEERGNISRCEDGFIVLFTKDGDTWRCVPMYGEGLIKSVFTKLYFMKGNGLEYFSEYARDENAGIYVYRIQWPER
ncbi:MAG: STT3 domain-containing protein [Candidatus Omnitrophota bacterium]